MSASHKAAAVILAGGTGSRLPSDRPKQYLSISGSMIISRTLRTFCHMPEISLLQIVAHPDWQAPIREELFSLVGPGEAYKLAGFSAPGESRQLSILSALRDLKKRLADGDLVILHDAVRPFVSAQTIRDCLDACRTHDGAMPALPLKDTVYYSTDGVHVSSLLDRSALFAGQSPEAFRFGPYLRATEALLPDTIYTIRGSTEVAFLAGMDVAIVPGDEENFKLTTPADLTRARQILQRENI